MEILNNLDSFRNYGYITIAIGGVNYGKMATNLALSIRNKSKYPIMLIYTPSAFNGIEWCLEYFDEKYCVKDTDNPSEKAMELKLTMLQLSTFSKTIFLDADTIVCPTKNMDDLFNIEGDFNAQCYSVKKLGSKPDKIYEHWMNYDLIIEELNLSPNDFIPQINSSFLMWVKVNCLDIQHEAIKAYLTLPQIKIKKWRGQVPDELCYNIACAITKKLPKKMRPLYVSGSESKEAVIENYYGLSLVGNNSSWKGVDIYNDFVRYYSQLNGLTKPFLFEPKQRVKRIEKPLFPHEKVTLAKIGGFGEISNGGIINPSAWRDGDSYNMILRVDENLEGYKGNKDNARCNPYLAKYDKDFNLLSVNKINHETKFLREDWRIYYIQKIRFSEGWGCCSYWDGKKWGQSVFWFNPEYLEITYIEDFKNDKDEKNWAWFCDKEDDLFVYSVEPFVVKKYGGEVIFSHDFKSGWADEGFISCSTFPVKYNGDYLMWVHKKQKDLTYLNSVMVFDAKTLKPKYFIPQHVLGAEGTDQPLYISSCIVEDDRILIFGGEGGVEETSNAAVKSATVRIIDRKIFDNIIKQYPCK